MCLKSVSLKSESFSLIPWAVLGWWRKNRRGAYFTPPGKMGLNWGAYLPPVHYRGISDPVQNRIKFYFFPFFHSALFIWRKAHLSLHRLILLDFLLFLFRQRIIRKTTSKQTTLCLLKLTKLHPAAQPYWKQVTDLNPCTLTLSNLDCWRGRNPPEQGTFLNIS